MNFLTVSAIHKFALAFFLDFWYNLSVVKIYKFTFLISSNGWTKIYHRPLGVVPCKDLSIWLSLSETSHTWTLVLLVT